MNILKQDKKRQEEDQKKQREQAEKLIKGCDDVIDFIVEQGFTEIWQFKSIHSLMAQKIQGAIDKTKIKDIIK